VARAVALAAAALLAGVALIRPLAGGPTDRARRVILAVAGAGALAAVIGAIGDLAVARYLLLVPLLALAAAAARFGPALLGVPAGGLLVGWLSWDTRRASTGTAVLLLAHVAVVAIWTGAALASATAEPSSRTAVVRRVGPVAVGAAVVAAGTGVLAAHNDNVTLHGITVTTFGTVVVLKAGLLLAAAILGLGARALLRARRAGHGGGGGGGRLPAGLELGVLSFALVVGAVLTSLPAPGPPPATGVPLARVLDLGEAITGLIVAPQRPGVNLVHLMTDRSTYVDVNGHRYQAQPLPGTQGLWAQIQLPAGRSLLTLHQGRQVAVQVVDTGAGAAQEVLSGPDGAECVAAALGALLGGSRGPLAPCPAQSLVLADAAALRAVVAYLGTRGVNQLTLIADASPRGVAAEREVRAAARTAGITVGEPAALAGQKPQAVLAVAGWQVSGTTLGRFSTAQAPTYGTYLAPWLLDSPLVAAAGGAPLAVLPFDPAGPPAQSYVSALRQIGPQQGASATGFYAYLAASGRALPPAPLVLYAAAGAFQILGASGHGSGETGVTWLGRGPLVAVSKPLPDPR
jgi:hypothetical protein